MTRTLVGRVLGGVAAGFGLLVLAGATIFGLSVLAEAGLGLIAVGASVAFC